MREMFVIINRVMCGLPITDEEREALKAHLAERKRINDRDVRIALLAGPVVVALITLSYWLNRWFSA